mmetsp:Transcript_18780/g.28920  ORF Transcript_18780/g.28920 Transcript_18780/m.28920 type:complete len:90 (+) Transcript_18780:1524-1793(+)
MTNKQVSMSNLDSGMNIYDDNGRANQETALDKARWASGSAFNINRQDSRSSELVTEQMNSAGHHNLNMAPVPAAVLNQLTDLPLDIHTR